MDPVTRLGIIFMAPLLVAAMAYMGMHIYLRFKNRRKYHVKTLVAPGGITFWMYFDMINNNASAWYVYELPEGTEPSPGMLASGNASGAILWSQFIVAIDPEEYGKMEIIDNRYLVFSRDDLYHSLYDLDQRKVLIHETNPQAEFAAWAETQDDDRQYFDEQDYMRWIREHLHGPIERILTEAAKRDHTINAIIHNDN